MFNQNNSERNLNASQNVISFLYGNMNAHDLELYSIPNIPWFCSLSATMSLETIECNSSLWVLILGQSKFWNTP